MKLANFSLHQVGKHFQFNEEFKKDPFFRWSLFLSLIAEVLTLTAVFLSWKKLPPLVPLFYSLPWGEEQLASPLILLLFLLSGFLISFVNLFLAYLLLTRAKFLAHILLITTIVVTFLICTTTLHILFMIT